VSQLSQADQQWVKFVPGEGGYCRLCTNHPSSSGNAAWVNQPSTAKDMKRAVREHQKNSDRHTMATKLQNNKNMPRHTESVNQQTLWALQKRLREVYFLCRETIALHKFAAVHELNTANEAYKGLENVLHAGNLSYTSHRFVNDAVEVLAMAVRNQVLNLVARSKYVGVLIDEGSDITQTSQLVVYYKLVVDGKPLVVFAGVEELICGDGETVFGALLHRLKKDGISLDQLVAFGSDGASVMLGHKDGVAGRLLALNVILVAFHCVNHRGALGVENAADECPYLTNKFVPTLEHLGRYFRFSNARTRSFYDAQTKWSKQAGAETLQRFVKICESAYTRWLTHGKTNKAVRVSYVPLAMGLEDADKKKAKEKEDKKAEKAAKKQKLDNSVVTSRSRVSAPSQAQLQAIQNQIFEKELSGQNQGKAGKK
jgi:hypothetical protein